MTTYPVDSATRPCCRGIGAHTQDCTAARMTTQLKDVTIARLVCQIDKCHERIKTLEAERDRLKQDVTALLTSP
jgi:hypothetical protein